VTDDGSAPGVTGLGSGHGLAGARERAEAAGGTLTAGPQRGGGWRVTAAVPVEPSPPPAPRWASQRWARSRWARSRRPGERRAWLRAPWLRGRFADVALSDALGLLPVTFALFADEADPGWSLNTADAALYALVLTLHALPVMWRRVAPWPAFAAVLATSWLWPAVAGETGPRSAWLFAAGAGTEIAAVYGVAAYARRGWTTWFAAPLAGASLSAVLVTIAASDGSVGGGPATTAATGGAWAFSGVITSMAFLAVWGIGFAVRIRRRRVAERDRSALSAAAADTVAVAHAERIRIAAGLREDVLARTAAVVEAAGRGQLDAVIAEARAGLVAMRDLLGSLRGDGDGARRDPQAAAAAIAGLCAEYRSEGREVALDAPTGLLPSLAPDADVSAFRLVDAVLGGGDTGPAQVSMHGDGRYLRITVEGVPVAATRPTVAGLRARLAAIGGGLSVDPAGTVRAWLPTRTVPEVTPWRSG
jgi:signal transduction histidine kinase